MARLHLLDHPTLPSYVEMRLWTAAGRTGDVFRLGATCSLDASQILWWEIIQVVAGRQVFYFRHFLDVRCASDFGAQVERFLRGDSAGVGIAGQSPDCGFTLRRVSDEAVNNSDDWSLPAHYALETWLSDVGFARAGILKAEELYPDGRMTFAHTTYNTTGVHNFLKDIVTDLARVLAGHWLDPRSLDPSASRWALAEQLDTLAYDYLAADFSEDYFRRSRVTKAFKLWLGLLPSNGTVLDIGCGHGNPVIGKLLDVGLQVTGLDISPAMLAQARQHFPQASFFQGTLQDLPAGAVFSGACSFSALLYLDPIDLSFALQRLHAALHPGGVLFLYAYFDHPGWVGEPVDRGMGVPLWAWDYDPEAASQALCAQGFFKRLHCFDFRQSGKGSGPYVLVAQRVD